MKRRTIVSALVVLAFACSSTGSGGQTGSDAGCEGACKDAQPADGGKQSSSDGEWPNAGCTAGMDETCNAEPTMNAIAGICSMSGTCLCEEDFAIDLKSGKCGVLMAKSGAPCKHGGGGCNDDPISSMRAGLCLTDGTCYCLGKASKNPRTGRCELP